MKRKEQACEFIEKKRALIKEEEEARKKKGARLILTEAGLVSRRSRSVQSPGSTRRSNKSGFMPELAKQIVEKSMPASTKVSPRVSVQAHRILRPFEPKRFTPASTCSRPKTPQRLMLRSRGEARKLDLKVDVKSFRSCGEKSSSLEKSYKYFVSDAVQSSPEPSQEVFSKLVFRADTVEPQHKTSGTLEEYNSLKGRSPQPSTNYTSTATGQLRSVGLMADLGRRGSDGETLRSRELVAMINRHRHKNISTMLSEKLQRIRGNQMFSTYN